MRVHGGPVGVGAHAVRLRLLGACAFCSMASMRVSDAMLPAMAGGLQTTVTQAAQAVSGFALAYGLFQLVFGPLGDRFGKLQVVAWTTLGCAVASAACAMAATPGALIASRAWAGACAAGIVPLTMAWIGDTVVYGERQAVLARLLNATVLGMVCGQWAGALLAGWLGWRSAFVVLSVLFLVGGLVLLRQVRQAPEGSRPVPASSVREQFFSVLSSPWARVVLAVTAVEGALAFSALTFLPMHLHAHLGLSMSAAGAITACYGVGGLLYARVARSLIRSVGECGLAAVGASALCLGFGAIALTRLWPVVVPACLVAGFGFYAMHNTLQTLATQMAPSARGTAVSLFVCALFLGQSAGVSVAAATLEQAPTRWIFASAAGGLFVLGLGLSALIGRRPH